MLLWGTSINADIIVDGNDTWRLVNDLVHVHFEDILAHLQAEKHAQEPIPPFVGVKHYQV